MIEVEKGVKEVRRLKKKASAPLGRLLAGSHSSVPDRASRGHRGLTDCEEESLLQRSEENKVPAKWVTLAC